MLRTQALGFEWPNGKVIFKNFNFSLGNQIWGVVGPNGIGKSTFLRVLAGELSPTEGRCIHQGRLIYLPQEQIKDGGQSGGEWMMERFEKALLETPAVLLLDEPTNHLDELHRQLFLRKIKSAGIGILIATHDRELLRALDSVLVIEGGELRAFAGGFEDYERQKSLEHKKRDEALLQSKMEFHRVKALADQKSRNQEKRNQRGAKSAPDLGLPKILIGARKRKAQETTGRISSQSTDKIQTAQKNFLEAVQNRVHDTKPYFAGISADQGRARVVLTVQNLTLELKGRTLWQETLNLCLRTGDRLWLRGENGTGKTSFLNLALGKGLAKGLSFKGDVQQMAFHSAYVSQFPEDLGAADQDLFSALRGDYLGTDQELMNQLASFQFPIHKARSPWCELSGGEKVRAQYAKLFLGAKVPDLLVLDEPSNHLDLETKDWLVQVLQKYNGALILVSHDRDFAQALNILQQITLALGPRGSGR